MNVTLPPPAVLQAAEYPPTAPSRDATALAEGDETREKFHSVMGEMIFSQILKAMRKTVGKPAYFHGGRAEEIFTQQLDQVLAEKISKASGETFLEPMYQLWTLGRK